MYSLNSVPSQAYFICVPSLEEIAEELKPWLDRLKKSGSRYCLGHVRNAYGAALRGEAIGLEYTINQSLG